MQMRKKATVKKTIKLNYQWFQCTKAKGVTDF